MKKILIIYFLVSIFTNSVLRAEEKPGEKKPYITGTFSSGFGEHINHENTLQGSGTAVEWISGGKVPWAKREETSKDTTLSLPLMFDLKLISKYGFGITFGDLLMISMNKNYRDANHIYFGFSYVHSIKSWDLGASLIVFPVYITDDALIAGKFDISYWLPIDIGITLSTMFGSTTTFDYVRVKLFSASLGVSLKF